MKRNETASEITEMKSARLEALLISITYQIMLVIFSLAESCPLVFLLKENGRARFNWDSHQGPPQKPELLFSFSPKQCEFCIPA